MTRSFLTVPVELVGTAEQLANHLDGEGYTIRVEPRELGYPSVPTLVGRLRLTNVIFEVASRVDKPLVGNWVSYAKSCNTDTRIVICLPAGTVVKPAIDAFLRALGCGLIQVDPTAKVERIPPVDQSLNLSLPRLSEQPARVRRLLGPAFEKVRGGNWRDGFEDACTTLQEEVANYLVRGVGRGRIRFLTRGMPVAAPTARFIRSRSLGQLLRLLERIQHPNAADFQLETGLRRLNPDRITAAHKRSSLAAEGRLRQNVGRHIWIILALVRVAYKDTPVSSFPAPPPVVVPTQPGTLTSARMSGGRSRISARALTPSETSAIAAQFPEPYRSRMGALPHFRCQL